MSASNVRAVPLVTVLLAGLLGSTGACSANSSEASQGGSVVTARQAADMIHAALAADRAVYTSEIVQRLTKVQKVQIINPETGQPTPLEAREDWKSEHGKLPLPAQMFRMGAERVLSANQGLSYLLLSPWPVNKQNIGRTKIEKDGLEQVTRSGAPLYAAETLDGKNYFVAIYPDKAVAEACVECHNKHPDSPRRDFKVGDTMGGIVIRFPTTP